MSFFVAFLPGLVVGLAAFSGAALTVNLTRKAKESDNVLLLIATRGD